MILIANGQSPEEVDWNAKIIVPFSPETPASGVNNTSSIARSGTGETFDPPKLEPGKHLLLHFGAVDYSATVWVNGTKICSHQGGYTPFHADITSTPR